MDPEISNEQITQAETHIIKQENSFKLHFLFATIALVISVGVSAYLYVMQVDLSREIEAKELVLSDHELVVGEIRQELLDYQTKYDDLEGRVNGYLRIRGYECKFEIGECLSIFGEQELVRDFDETEASVATDSAELTTTE